MGLENLEAHPNSRYRDLRSLLAPDRSQTDLSKAAGSGSKHQRRGSGLRLLPPKLANAPFMRYIAQSDDSNDKDEGDIYGGRVMSLVFTHERWDNHRSTLRYAKHLLYMFNSNMFKALLGPMAAVMLVSLLVGLYETLLKTGALPESWPHLTLALGQAFNLTAFALSLLLVFRTNSSYDRWWEARKLWGGVVNRTRDVVRQGLVFYRDEDVHLKELLARWTMAFPVVLMVHLRASMDLAEEIKSILPPEEATILLSAQHRPNFVLQVIAEVQKAARLDPIIRSRLDDNLTFFEDAMGSMERILRTPIPLSYTRHTSRFLLIWMLMLPFTMWAAYSWTTVLLSAIFAFLMLGIDEIGVQIEVLGLAAHHSWPPPTHLPQEPFGVLPIEAYCQTIERNIRELLSRNYDVGQLVLRQALPLGPTDAGAVLHQATDGSAGSSGEGGAAGEAGGNPFGSGASAYSGGAVSGQQQADEDFGEMTGAAAQPLSAASLAKGGALSPRTVSLTATAGFSSPGFGSPGLGAAGLAGSRRVRFAEEHGAGSGGGSPVAGAAAVQRDMIEIELGPASESVPLAPSSMPRSSYASTWLK